MEFGANYILRASVTPEGTGNFIGLPRTNPNSILRKRIDVCNVHRSKRLLMVVSSSKQANLSASRKQRIKLPIIDLEDENGENKFTFSDFLKHPSGMEAVINAKALQSYQLIDDGYDNTYRCTLPKIQLISFEVIPVLVLRVTPTHEDCTVELLSCKLEGSEILENQSFSAAMVNCMTWNIEEAEPFLEIDVSLNVTLEISTRPFTMLPVSAVEAPGNLVMQTLVDTLVPLMLQQLLQDYGQWILLQQQTSL